MGNEPKNMNKFFKILLGIMTLYPLLHLFFFIGLFGFIAFKIFGGQVFNEHSQVFPFLIISHISAMVFILGLIGFYSMHIYKCNPVSSEKKILWLILIVFVNVFSMPVYWYLFVWKGPQGQVMTADEKNKWGIV